MTFPLFIELKDLPCLVVGGGEVASRKAQTLSAFGAAVTMIAGMDAVGGTDIPPVRVVRRNFADGDIEGMSLVVSATDAFGTVYPKTRHLAVTNGSFEVRFERFRPGRLLFLADTYPQRLHAEVLWPAGMPKVLNRLRLPWSHGPSFGVIGR